MVSPFGGAGSESLLQGGAAVPPPRAESAPAVLHPPFKGFCQGLRRLDRLRVGGDAHRAVSIQALQLQGQCIRVEPRFQQARQIGGGQSENVLSPEVMGHVLGQGLRIVVKAQFQGLSALQGLPAQCAPAKPMDGGDVCAFQRFECFQQPARQKPALTGVLPVPLQPFLQHRIRAVEIYLLALPLHQALQCAIETAADPVAQFIGRGFGEGHHQQLVQR